jgi:hypothetical protein
MLWIEALGAKAVWLRAARWGVPVGLLQAVINQGDFWLHHAVDSVVLIKTIVSPMVTFSVALLSAAGMYVDRAREYQNGNR